MPALRPLSSVATLCPDLPPALLFARGSKNEIYLLRVAAGKDETRTYVVRLLFGPARVTRQMRHVEEEVETHDELQKAGVPVIPRFQLCSEKSGLGPEEGVVWQALQVEAPDCCCDDKWICSTDLTQGQRKYVLSETNRTMDDRELAQRYAKGEFAQPVPNLESLFQAAVTIAAKSAETGREFQTADTLFFIIDKQTRVTELIVGDYKHATRSRGRPYTDVHVNNLAVCREAFLVQKEVLGLSADAIRHFFESEIQRVTANVIHERSPDVV